MSQSRPTKSEVDTYAGHYVLYGEQSNAFRVTFPNSKAKAETIHVKASVFHSIDKVQIRIAELKEQVRAIAEKDFKIDAAWVLKQAVEVHNRCMQGSPVYDRSGERVFIETPDGETAAAYTFEHTGANKSLEIIGKHIDVAAFSENIKLTEVKELTPWGNVQSGVDEDE